MYSLTTIEVRIHNAFTNVWYIILKLQNEEKLKNIFVVFRLILLHMNIVSTEYCLFLPLEEQLNNLGLLLFNICYETLIIVNTVMNLQVL